MEIIVFLVHALYVGFFVILFLGATGFSFSGWRRHRRFMRRHHRRHGRRRKW